MMRELLETRRFWLCLLMTGIVLHVLAALLMPVGLDAHLHSVYVTDGMEDGEPSLDWGPVRTVSDDGSIPSTVDSDDRWVAWHLWIQAWFESFGASTSTLHAMGLVTGLLALVAVFVTTQKLWGPENALRLTALASIYPPLVRAAGRCYQEGAILGIFSLIFYSLIMGERQRKLGCVPWWWLVSILCIGIILDLKGLPSEGMIIVAVALRVWSYKEEYFSKLQNREKIFMLLTVSIATLLFAFIQNGINMSEVALDIALSSLVSVALVLVVFVYVGMGLFARAVSNKLDNNEAYLIQNAGVIGLGIVLGYVAALWIVEAVNLGMGFVDVWWIFRYNPRYSSFLILPLWWMWMANGEKNSMMPLPSREAFFAASITILLLLNAYILVQTGPRGMEDIGKSLSDEVEDGDEILYIAPRPLAMHRLYAIQLDLDPQNELDIVAHWRSPDSSWSEELEDCSKLGRVNWIIIDPYAETPSIEGSEFEYETESDVLFTIIEIETNCSSET